MNELIFHLFIIQKFIINICRFHKHRNIHGKIKESADNVHSFLIIRLKRFKTRIFDRNNFCRRLSFRGGCWSQNKIIICIFFFFFLFINGMYVSYIVCSNRKRLENDRSLSKKNELLNKRNGNCNYY